MKVEGEIKYDDPEFSVICFAELQSKQYDAMRELLQNRSDEWYMFRKKFEAILFGCKKVNVSIRDRKFAVKLEPGIYVAYAHFKGFSKAYIVILKTDKRIFVPGKYTEPLIVEDL